MDHRSQPRNETGYRRTRQRGEDRWSRRGDYERDPVDPFERADSEEWELEAERSNRFGEGQTRYDRGFDQLEEWQWRGRREPRHGPGQFSDQGYSQRIPPYGYYQRGYAAQPRAWSPRASDTERFGTRQPFGSAEYRGVPADRGMHSGKGPKGYRRSDERIHEELSDRLTTDPEIDASEISISVRQGEVTLEGSVCERSMKRATEDLAEDVNGVQEVHNRLRVQRRDSAESASAATVNQAQPVGGAHASSAFGRSGEKH